MSFSTSDISNLGGPGSSAEPSMEEILASIRRILKEDDSVKAVPVDLDDDVLVLDQSMLARPADVSAVTYMPVEPPPSLALEASPEPLHFSSEPTPFAEDFSPRPEAPTPMAYDPVVAVPQLSSSFAEPVQDAPVTVAYDPVEPPAAPRAPLIAEPPPAPEPAPFLAEPVQAEPVQAEPAQAEPAPSEPVEAAPFSYSPPPEPIWPEPPQLEAKMPENSPENVEPPHSIISDKTTDAAASAIGALVRSMSMEKSVAVSRHGTTIEDIVREEIRPLLKSWLDTHLPSLVERVVRTEIERVIDRSGT